MVVISILFWLWFLMSIVILVRRAIRRSGERRARRAATKLALHDSPAEATSTEDKLSSLIDEIEGTEPEITDFTPHVHTTEAAAPIPTPVATAPEPTRAPVPAPITEPVAADAAPAAASPAPAPAPASVATISVATIARTAATPLTVAQVIAGIEMPCALVPLTLSDHDSRYDRGQRAHFFTTQAPAAVVGAAVTEELERIGLTVTTFGDNATIARRGRLAVEIRVHTIGALVKGVASPLFRSAPPDCVVVEFDVVPAE
jgi:hypothetical protein